MCKENDKFKFANFYCDPLSLIAEKERHEKLSTFTNQDIFSLYEYAFAKNYKAGVKDVYCVNNDMIDLSILAVKYNLNIKNIVGAENIFKIPSSFLVGNNLIVELKNIEEYNDSFLSDVMSFCAKLNLSILIEFGRDLNSLGKLSSRYNKEPEKVLEDFGFLDKKCFLLGCNYLDKDAISLFDSYDIEYIFTPLADGEKGRGFLNFKLFENKVCHIGTESVQNIDLIKEIDFLRLETNNLLCRNNLIDETKYFKLLQQSIEDNMGLSYNGNSFNEKIDLKLENFQKLEENVLNLLAQKG